MSDTEMFNERDTAVLRECFEKLAKDSFGFKRSRRGTYFNPAIARDWKWFQAGARAALEEKFLALGKVN